MLKIAIKTLGCKANRCDADALVSALCVRGHNAFSTRDFDQNADIFVVNTCTVTHTSDKKSRQMLRRARRKNPDAHIAVCGCLAAKTDATSLDADFVFDARKPEEFFEKISRISASRARLATHAQPRSCSGRARSFIKIQDGCDRFCAYCIVPHVRGEVTSRPPDEILAEAAHLVAEGTPEIVLTGIQLAAYGQDVNTVSLPALIKKVAATGVRLRLSSIDPWAVSGDFLDAVKSSPALCDHFHLSLQSGCDATLSRMNRRYTTADYAAAAAALRKIRPAAALTTDIIVGFPGESDIEFEESLQFVREMNFAQIHVFEFSPREGTPAANFPTQLPPKIKRRRGKIMRELAAELEKEFLQKQLGTTASVLFEKKKSPGVFVGNTENYCTVAVQSGENLVRTVRKVKITAREGDILTGLLH